MKFTVGSGARADLAEQVRYYVAINPSLANSLLTLYSNAIISIESDPRQYAIVDDPLEGLEVREYFIMRFKLRLIYVLTDVEIGVLALVHARRRPNSWHNRAKEFTP